MWTRRHPKKSTPRKKLDLSCKDFIHHHHRLPYTRSQHCNFLILFLHNICTYKSDILIHQISIHARNAFPSMWKRGYERSGVVIAFAESDRALRQSSQAKMRRILPLHPSIHHGKIHDNTTSIHPSCYDSATLLRHHLEKLHPTTPPKTIIKPASNGDVVVRVVMEGGPPWHPILMNALPITDVQEKKQWP